MCLTASLHCSTLTNAVTTELILQCASTQQYGAKSLLYGTAVTKSEQLEVNKCLFFTDKLQLM